MTKKELSMTKEEKLECLIEKARFWKSLSEARGDDKLLLDIYDIESLIGMLEDVWVKCGDFFDDAEKMWDFHKMTKDAFLASYSYLTEDEYDNTKLLDDAKSAKYYKKRFEDVVKENRKFKEAFNRMHSINTRLGRTVYKDINLQGDGYVYLFTEQEAYGDRSYYQDVKTGELYDEWFSIGD